MVFKIRGIEYLVEIKKIIGIFFWFMIEIVKYRIKKNLKGLWNLVMNK